MGDVYGFLVERHVHLGDLQTVRPGRGPCLQGAVGLGFPAAPCFFSRLKKYLFGCAALGLVVARELLAVVCGI